MCIAVYGFRPPVIFLMNGSGRMFTSRDAKAKIYKPLLCLFVFAYLSIEMEKAWGFS